MLSLETLRSMFPNRRFVERLQRIRKDTGSLKELQKLCKITIQGHF